MKTLNKTAVDRRFERSSIKPIIKISNVNYKPEGSKYKYDKVLEVVIPGKPIADGRVRFGQDSIYNPNKANMMKIFDRMYPGSEAENLIIFGQIMFDIMVYIPIPKVTTKLIGKGNMKLVEKELFPSMCKPDNDNFEKISFDLLQDDHYMIIFDDESIVENRTRKYYVKKEELARLHMRVYFNSKVDKWVMDKAKSSRRYLKYIISPKYFKSNNIPTSKWKQHFFASIVEWVKNNKNNKSIPDLVNSILRVYSTPELYYLCDGRNVDDVKNKIITIVERICL